MFQLKQNIQQNLPDMGYSPNILIEYLQTLFGDVRLQFWLTSLGGKVYIINVVNNRIFYYITFDGKIAETHAMPLREIGKIDEHHDGVNYSAAIFDSGNRVFYSISATDTGLIMRYRNLVKILLAEC